MCCIQKITTPFVRGLLVLVPTSRMAAMERSRPLRYRGCGVGPLHGIFVGLGTRSALRLCRLNVDRCFVTFVLFPILGTE